MPFFPANPGVMPCHAMPCCAVPRSVQELKTKKRYGRLQKAMGDYCLLAGSPQDGQVSGLGLVMALAWLNHICNASVSTELPVRRRKSAGAGGA